LELAGRPIKVSYDSIHLCFTPSIGLVIATFVCRFGCQLVREVYVVTMGLEVNPLSLTSKSKVLLENIENYSVQVYLSCKFEEVSGTSRVYILTCTLELLMRINVALGDLAIISV
jgi:hypothetical protein